MNDDGDRFVVIGPLTDGTEWAASRGPVKIDRVTHEQFAGYRLADWQPDEAP